MESQTKKSVEKSKRDVQMDLLRIMCCMGIILLHESGHLDLGGKAWPLYQVFVRPCLWAFGLLSGYFVLAKKVEPIGAFYRKRLLGLLIPLAGYSLLYQFVNGYLLAGEGRSLLHTFSFRQILANQVAGHLWFVYVIFGLYMATPFLQRMLEHLSDRQLIGFLVLVYVFTALPDYLKQFGIEIMVSQIFSGVLFFYYVLGYALRRLHLESYRKWMIIVGILNILINLVMGELHILEANLYTSSVQMVISVLFYYSLMRSVPFLGNVRVRKLLATISDHTYGIYLVHILVLEQLYRSFGKLYDGPHVFLVPVVLVFLNFLISMAISLLFDCLLLNPIENVCLRRLGRNNRSIIKSE